MPSGIITLIIVTGSMFALFIIITTVGNYYSLNQIKNKTVGQGQHGTARWATKKEIKRTYKQIDFQPNEWRNNPESRPKEQGIVVGCKNSRKGTTAMVDTGDVHALMIGAAGVGKTAYWLYPCIEYACATGMSFMVTDTKGDVVRHYGTIAEKYYGYKISVIDLRNPTRSHGKEGADVIIDNTQLTIFGGFAPNSTSAEVLSKALGSRTVMSGSVSRSKNDPSQSLQMIERPLMTPDELKSLPKGTFVVMKTGFYPMKVKLKLFFKLGIKFEEKYEVKENGNREVHYANRSELFNNIIQAYSPVTDSDFDEANGEKKKKNENLKTSPDTEQTECEDTINSEQQNDPTEEPENSSVEQSADKQRKVVIRTERPPQEVLDNE